MKRKGPWSAAETEAFLGDVRVPVRLACNGGSGHPVLLSLWFLPLEGRLWCATQRTARVVSALEADPRCSFEVSVEAPPYYGVRGPALATRHDERGEEILRALLERYLGGTSSHLAGLLLARVATETALAIEPQALVSWDFRSRMSDLA